MAIVFHEFNSPTLVSPFLCTPTAASLERILINNSSKTYSPLCGMFQLRNHSSFVERRHIEFAVEVPQPSGSQAGGHKSMLTEAHEKFICENEQL